MNNNSITTLRGMPVMKNLQELHIANNKLKDINEFNNMFPNLDLLDVSQNEISGSITNIASVLCKMENLYMLQIQGNPCTNREE